LVQNQPQRLADLDVREVRSITLEGRVYRALTGYEESYAFLFIDAIQLPEIEGDSARLLGSWNISTISGGKEFEIPIEGAVFRDVRWASGHLQFVYESPLGRKTCTVASIETLRPSLNCRRSR
jgi:hypothetical protein